MHTHYKLAANTFGSEEIDAAKAVLDSGFFTMGPNVATFEEQFAKWVGSSYALMVNSGSSANLLMVDAMLRRSYEDAPWKPGDEVIVPALAWPTTVWPLIQLGLNPVFVDVDSETLAISLNSTESALSNKTRGMFLIHALGQVPDMEKYVSFCRQHHIELIEDVCESLGGFHGARHAGNFGQMGSFSFYFSHHISTIEGGMIITSNRELFDDLKSLRAHGWIRDRSDRDSWSENSPDLDARFLFATSGYNVRPTDIQGAIGQIQLGRLEKMLRCRESLARKVDEWVAENTPWLELLGASRLPGQPGPRQNRTNSWLTLAFRLRKTAPVDLKKVKAHFEADGIETRPIIAGNLGRHPAFRKLGLREAGSLEVCDDLLRNGFMIGCHPQVSSQSLETLQGTFESLRHF